MSVTVIQIKTGGWLCKTSFNNVPQSVSGQFFWTPFLIHCIFHISFLPRWPMKIHSVSNTSKRPLIAKMRQLIHKNKLQWKKLNSDKNWVNCYYNQAINKTQPKRLTRSTYHTTKTSNNILPANGSCRSGDMMRFRRRALYSSSRSPTRGARCSAIGSKS